jgi:hypothetical protein
MAEATTVARNVRHMLDSELPMRPEKLRFVPERYIPLLRQTIPGGSQDRVRSYHTLTPSTNQQGFNAIKPLYPKASMLRKTTENPVSRCNYQQKAGLSCQQFYASGKNHFGALQMSVARRTLFQMDQATSKNQSLLRHLGECDKTTEPSNKSIQNGIIQRHS